MWVNRPVEGIIDVLVHYWRFMHDKHFKIYDRCTHFQYSKNNMGQTSNRIY